MTRFAQLEAQGSGSRAERLEKEGRDGYNSTISYQALAYLSRRFLCPTITAIFPPFTFLDQRPDATSSFSNPDRGLLFAHRVTRHSLSRPAPNSVIFSIMRHVQSCRARGWRGIRPPPPAAIDPPFTAIPLPTPDASSDSLDVWTSCSSSHSAPPYPSASPGPMPGAPQLRTVSLPHPNSAPHHASSSSSTQSMPFFLRNLSLVTLLMLFLEHSSFAGPR